MEFSKDILLVQCYDTRPFESKARPGSQPTELKEGKEDEQLAGTKKKTNISPINPCVEAPINPWPGPPLWTLRYLSFGLEGGGG